MPAIDLPSEAAEKWPAAAGAWASVALFCVVAILSYTDRQVLSLLVDPIRESLHVSDTQVGILQGVAFAIVYSLAGLPLGRLADLVQRRRVILAGIAIWSAGTLVCGYAASFWPLFVGRLIVGVGEAALAPAAMSMISDMFPAERRGLAIGVFTMGMAIGGGVAVGIGGAVLGLAASGGFASLPLVGTLAPWRAVLVLLGLAGLPLLALLLLVREPSRQGANHGISGERFGVVVGELVTRRRTLVPTILGCACMSVGDFALLSWSPALLARRFAFTPAETGAALGGLIVAVSILASVGGGVVSDQLERRAGPAGRLRLASISAVIASPFALIGLAGSGPTAVGMVALWMLFSTAAGIAGITASQEIVPNRARGLSVALIAFGNIMLGLGGGATLTGFLTDRLFGDPLAIGRSLSIVVIPAALLAILLFHLAARAARSRPL